MLLAAIQDSGWPSIAFELRTARARVQTLRQAKAIVQAIASTRSPTLTFSTHLAEEHEPPPQKKGAANARAQRAAAAAQ